jgi:hypothetical protein
MQSHLTFSPYIHALYKFQQDPDDLNFQLLSSTPLLVRIQAVKNSVLQATIDKLNDLTRSVLARLEQIGASTPHPLLKERIIREMNDIVNSHYEGIKHANHWLLHQPGFPAGQMPAAEGNPHNPHKRTWQTFSVEYQQPIAASTREAKRARLQASSSKASEVALPSSCSNPKDLFILLCGASLGEELASKKANLTRCLQVILQIFVPKDSVDKMAGIALEEKELPTFDQLRPTNWNRDELGMQLLECILERFPGEEVWLEQADECCHPAIFVLLQFLKRLVSAEVVSNCTNECALRNNIQVVCRLLVVVSHNRKANERIVEAEGIPIILQAALFLLNGPSAPDLNQLHCCCDLLGNLFAYLKIDPAPVKAMLLENSFIPLLLSKACNFYSPDEVYIRLAHFFNCVLFRFDLVDGIPIENLPPALLHALEDNHPKAFNIVCLLARIAFYPAGRKMIYELNGIDKVSAGMLQLNLEAMPHLTPNFLLLIRNLSLDVEIRRSIASHREILQLLIDYLQRKESPSYLLNLNLLVALYLQSTEQTRIFLIKAGFINLLIDTHEHFRDQKEQRSVINKHFADISQLPIPHLKNMQPTILSAADGQACTEQDGGQQMLVRTAALTASATKCDFCAKVCLEEIFEVISPANFIYAGVVTPLYWSLCSAKCGAIVEHAIPMILATHRIEREGKLLKWAPLADAAFEVDDGDNALTSSQKFPEAHNQLFLQLCGESLGSTPAEINVNFKCCLELLWKVVSYRGALLIKNQLVDDKFNDHNIIFIPKSLYGLNRAELMLTFLAKILERFKTELFEKRIITEESHHPVIYGLLQYLSALPANDGEQPFGALFVPHVCTLLFRVAHNAQISERLFEANAVPILLKLLSCVPTNHPIWHTCSQAIQKIIQLGKPHPTRLREALLAAPIIPHLLQLLPKANSHLSAELLHLLGTMWMFGQVAAEIQLPDCIAKALQKLAEYQASLKQPTELQTDSELYNALKLMTFLKMISVKEIARRMIVEANGIEVLIDLCLQNPQLLEHPLNLGLLATLCLEPEACQLFCGQPKLICDIVKLANQTPNAMWTLMRLYLGGQEQTRALLIKKGFTELLLSFYPKAVEARGGVEYMVRVFSLLSTAEACPSLERIYTPDNTARPMGRVIPSLVELASRALRDQQIAYAEDIGIPADIHSILNRAKPCEQCSRHYVDYFYGVIALKHFVERNERLPAYRFVCSQECLQAMRDESAALPQNGD